MKHIRTRVHNVEVKRRQTFADIFEEVQTAPKRPTTGELMLRAPNGAALGQRNAQATAGEARQLVSRGALLAFENCGCGGWGSCAPDWIDEAGLARAARVTPRLGRRAAKGTWPSWIDIWDDGTTTAVYVHGDIVWSDVCA